MSSADQQMIKLSTKLIPGDLPAEYYHVAGKGISRWLNPCPLVVEIWYDGTDIGGGLDRHYHIK
jgi:hypothetical protein